MSLGTKPNNKLRTWINMAKWGKSYLFNKTKGAKFPKNNGRPNSGCTAVKVLPIRVINRRIWGMETMAKLVQITLRTIYIYIHIYIYIYTQYIKYISNTSNISNVSNVTYPLLIDNVWSSVPIVQT